MKELIELKKEYIDKTIKLLDEVRELKIRKEVLNDEIEFLKKNEKLSSINFNELGFPIHSGNYGIDDMIINSQEKIYIKETEIEIIDSRIEMINIYTKRLSEEEQEIISLRHFDKKVNSYEKISELLMISKTAVQKKYTYALKKIALMKYGEEAKKNMANSISPPKNDPGGLISNTDVPTSIFLRMKK
ncbi:sigma-70 family RNA polymerase sigma factor [Clostridioides difficile]|nr:sigma-70 family RNA polymerase sigma factor [Clostridioides difficile]